MRAFEICLNLAFGKKDMTFLHLSGELPFDVLAFHAKGDDWLPLIELVFCCLLGEFYFSGFRN